jgi:hypothetical protein
MGAPGVVELENRLEKQPKSTRTTRDPTPVEQTHGD